jgi:hypothetical protein
MSIQEFVQEAKTKAKGEAAKSTAGVRAYVESFVSSRIAMALSLLGVIVFSTTAIYAPYRLAPLAQVDFAQQGVMAQGPSLDLSDLNISEADQKEKAQSAVSEAVPYVQNAYGAAEKNFPALPFWINVLGAVLSLAALIYTIKLQVRAARTSTRSIAI